MKISIHVSMMMILLTGVLTAQVQGTLPVETAGNMKTRTGPRDLPVLGQYAVSEVLGQDRSTFHMRATRGGFRAFHACQSIVAEFGRMGMEIHADGMRWGIRLQAVGRGQASRQIEACWPEACRNRVIYRHDVLEQWYVNGPLGLQQGFTVLEKPVEASGKTLTLWLGLHGDMKASLHGDRRGLDLKNPRGRDVLSYTGLLAYDVSGHRLEAWLEIRNEQLLVRVNDAGAVYPIVIDPLIQRAKLTASDGANSDILGTSVSISGDTVVVGATGVDVGNNADQGAVYVFEKPASGWKDLTQTAKLTASDGMAQDEFGNAVSINGDTVVVGAARVEKGSNIDQGAVYVFVKPASGWQDMTQTAKLTASDGIAQDEFGNAVSINGDTVVVGAARVDKGSNIDQGAVYVFVKPASGWKDLTQTAKLAASDGMAQDEFGNAVSINGDTVVVGAGRVDKGSNIDQGAVYVFVKPASGWQDMTQTAKLTASDGNGGDHFGISASISGDTLAVGAYRWNFEQGAVYVFVKPAGGWKDMIQTAKLTASDGRPLEHLGFSTSVDQDTVVVGAHLAEVSRNLYQGAVYVFEKPSGGWKNMTQTVKLTALDGIAHDEFGSAVSICGPSLVVGAPYARIGSNQYQGAAYVYTDGLSGSYTINPEGHGPRNFTSLQAGVNALRMRGVSGPVTLQLASRTFTGKLVLSPIPGASTTNTITLVASGAPAVIDANGAQDGVTLEDGCAYYRFENLKIQGCQRYGIFLDGSASSPSGCHHNIFVNVEVDLPASNIDITRALQVTHSRDNRFEECQLKGAHALHVGHSQSNHFVECRFRSGSHVIYTYAMAKTVFDRCTMDGMNTAYELLVSEAEPDGDNVYQNCFFHDTGAVHFGIFMGHDGLGNMFWHNTVFVKTSAPAVYMGGDGTWSHASSWRNNIIVNLGTGPAVQYGEISSVPPTLGAFDADHNCYYAPNSTTGTIRTTKGTFMGSLMDWKKYLAGHPTFILAGGGTRYDQNSIDGDPGVTRMPSNYRLRWDSQCLDRGTMNYIAGSWITFDPNWRPITDIDGTPRPDTTKVDIGADEMGPALSGTGTAKIGSFVAMSFSALRSAGLRYQAGSSLGTGPLEIDIRFIHLTWDGILFLSISGLAPRTFINYAGNLSSQGTGSALLMIPDLPELVGLAIHSAFVTVDPMAPSGIRAISNTLSTTVVGK